MAGRTQKRSPADAHAVDDAAAETSSDAPRHLRDSAASPACPSVWHILIQHRAPGITNTLTWTTLNTIDAKIELDNSITKGLKAEILGTFKPESSATPAAAKLNLHWKQPQYHLRVFGDLLKGPTANADLVLGHGGFVVGGEAGYDVQKAALTKWSLAAGYLNKEHSAAITGSNNLSIFSASFFKNVSDEIQAGAKATYDAKSSGQVGLELASRYKVDSLSFAKVCLTCCFLVTHAHVLPRPRSTTRVSLLSPTTPRSAPASPLASVPPLTPRS